MTGTLPPGREPRVYRVDKFTVPDGARGEFLERVRQTHEILRIQPGFLQDLVLEQPADPGRFHLVTMVAWEGTDAIERAKAVVAERQKASGFRPQELLARLGIRAELGSYRDAGL